MLAPASILRNWAWEFRKFTTESGLKLVRTGARLGSSKRVASIRYLKDNVTPKERPSKDELLRAFKYKTSKRQGKFRWSEKELDEFVSGDLLVEELLEASA